LANNNIKISVEESKTNNLSQGTEAGASKSEVQAEIKGGNVEIPFNAKYVLDLLSVIGDENIVLEFTDSLSAGVFKSEKDNNFIYIVMPLRVE
jgi:DNA polymerase-3 subunit beta